MTTWGRKVAVSSRYFDRLNLMICDLKSSVDLRRLFYSGAIILRWSCFPSVDAFSCASSNEKAVCTCNCISCKHRASYLCVSTCESSDCLKSCKLSCTDCMQTAFLQNAAACVSSGYQHCCMNSCNGHNWNASPRNVLACAAGGDHLLCRNRCTEGNCMVFPLKEWAGASWDHMQEYSHYFQL